MRDLGLSKSDSSKAQFLADLFDANPQSFIDVSKKKVSFSAARRDFLNQQEFQRLTEIAQRSPKLPIGRFHTIILDPPWPLERAVMRAESTEPQNLPYPVMSLEEIENLDIIKKFADTNCHIFLWTTCTMLPHAFKVLEKWGVNYGFPMVWVKNRGMQNPNRPQFNCEFVLYGKIGSPLFVDCTDFKNVIDAPARKHSEKPEGFYDLISRVTVGRRLDCFNRRRIEGFVGYGLEAPENQNPNQS